MNHARLHLRCRVDEASPKNDVVDDDFFSASVFKSLHSREPKMNVMECIAYRSHCYLYGPIHASFAARRCRRTFLAEWRLSLHRWTYESECRCIRYVKYPKLNNGVSIRCIMFADICDVKSRQPFRKTTSSTMTFFRRPFSSLHSREPKMNVMEFITYRSHCYSYGPIHASFVARRCRRMFFLRSGGFHSIDGCMTANVVVYDT